MPLRTCLFIITNIIVSEIMVHPVHSKWVRRQPGEGRDACDDNDLYFRVMEKCVETGEVLDKVSFSCQELHSQGPCEEGEMFVFAKDPCLQTECVTNRNSSGIACAEGWFNCKGTCTKAGSEDCEGQFGRRVRPDLYGGVQCVCDQQLGFVEFEGECHFEFLQGPCQDGEQLIVDSSYSLEPKCAKNTCSINQGFIIQRTDSDDYICQEEAEFFTNYNHTLLTEEESLVIKRLKPPVRLVPFASTFNNCHTRSIKTGDCVERQEEPSHSSNRFSLLISIKRAFNFPTSDKRTSREQLVFVEIEDMILSDGAINGTSDNVDLLKLLNI